MRPVLIILDSILANIVVATQLVQHWSCWVQYGTDAKQVFGKTHEKMGKRWEFAYDFNIDVFSTDGILRQD